MKNFRKALVSAIAFTMILGSTFVSNAGSLTIDESGVQVPLVGDMKGTLKSKSMTSYGGIDVYSGDEVSVEGGVNVKPIKDQIRMMAGFEPEGDIDYSSAPNIPLSGVRSHFAVTLNLPTELTLPQNLTKEDLHFTDNLFDVEIVSQDEHSIRLWMYLKNENYSSFSELLRDVDQCPDFLSVRIDNVLVGDVAEGEKYVSRGELKGDFSGTAVSRDFKFYFPVTQDASSEGLVDKNAIDAESIVLSFVGRVMQKPLGDILLKDGDTEITGNDKVFQGEKGKDYPILFKCDLTGYKKKLLQKLTAGSLKEVENKLVLVMNIPEGLELKEGASLTDNSGIFEVSTTDLDAQNKNYTLSGKSDDDTAENYTSWVRKLPDELILTLDGVHLIDSAADGTNYTITSQLGAMFKGFSTVENGENIVLNERAMWLQDPKGKDVASESDEVMSLSMTPKAEVTEEEPVTTEPDTDNPKDEETKPVADPKGPNTGDETNVMLFVILGITSLLGAGAALSLKKLKK